MRATVLRVVILALILLYAFGCLFYFINLTKEQVSMFRIVAGRAPG